MKFKSLIFTIFVITATLTAFAVNDWFHVFYSKDGLLKVNSNLISDIDSLYYTRSDAETEEPEDSLTEYVENLNVALKDGSIFSVPLDSVRDLGPGDNVPTLYIDTDESVDEITDKENYLTARIRYIPYDGKTDTLETSVNIKSRGNSSRELPKKPYRLKFDKKQALGGLPKAKSFVLIANYLDNTLMKNSVAFKMADILEMPYNCSAVPVEVVLNGKPRGSYILTTKIGITSASVDIDEEKGILWEMDTYYDEDYRFKSSRYYLPCMVKDPDLNEVAAEDVVVGNLTWSFWRSDLDLTIAKVYADKWEDVIDAEQIAKYVLVYDLLGNHEISHPKSTYLYKADSSKKYSFGPVWDFDWGLNYVKDHTATTALLGSGSSKPFFQKIFATEAFRKAFEKELNAFAEGGLEELLTFIDEYAEMIRITALRDSDIWSIEHNAAYEAAPINKARFDQNVQALKEFIIQRFSNIQQSQTFLLY